MAAVGRDRGLEERVAPLERRVRQVVHDDVVTLENDRLTGTPAFCGALGDRPIPEP
jgi:hypothetical protein